ncbi:hypothetical protein GW17_00038995 [Ensete ventricosum]|nr:hypothetical protein GW17_00038995 [Ensete ventricosum]
MKQRHAIRRDGRRWNPHCRPLLRIDSKVRVGDMSRVFGGCRVLTAAAKAEAAGETAKKVNSGLLKRLPVSPAMKKFVGASETSRFIIQLQNPADKREICCDDKLKSIFDGKDKVGMFEVSRLISSHFPKSK